MVCTKGKFFGISKRRRFRSKEVAETGLKRCKDSGKNPEPFPQPVTHRRIDSLERQSERRNGEKRSFRNPTLRISRVPEGFFSDSNGRRGFPLLTHRHTSSFWYFRLLPFSGNPSLFPRSRSLVVSIRHYSRVRIGMSLGALRSRIFLPVLQTIPYENSIEINHLRRGETFRDTLSNAPAPSRYQRR